MQYSYHWLKELSGTKKSAEQLGRLLLTRAFEVESIEKNPLPLDDFVIGEVMTLERHPNADRLQVATVRLKGDETHRIVCGAPNIEAGQKVVVALPGVTLPSGQKIEAVKLRGVESYGMICSERELGLSEAHEGILVLPHDAPRGALFGKHYGFDDTLLDIKVLPDRGGDALAYEGMAREIAALDGYAPRFEEHERKRLRIPSYNRAPKVSILDKTACRRFLGLSFKEVALGATPFSLFLRLFQAGKRSVNNVVDLTNYLMLLSGQPLHAYDADRLSGGVVVRRAKRGERLKLLTGETLRLDPDDIVIADQKRALGLAGIMGGAHSAVTEKTKNVFLEIATFDAASIRRSRVRHHLNTDASYRFERGLDPNLPTEVAPVAASLFAEMAGGKLAGLRDVYPKKEAPRRLRLELSRVEEVLGEKVPLFEAVKLLALLGLRVKKRAGAPVLDVVVPTRRQDLRDEWDLIEEIGRLRGYEKITPAAPLLPIPKAFPKSLRPSLRIKTLWADLGLAEAPGYSFYSVADADRLGLPQERHLELENPMNPDQALLRTSLLPNLLQKAAHNARDYERFGLFECGSVFFQEKGKALEEKRTAIVSLRAAGSLPTDAFFDLKGRLEAAIGALTAQTTPRTVFEPLSAEEAALFPFLHPKKSARILFDGEPLGVLGELRTPLLRELRLAKRGVALFEGPLAPWLELASREPRYVPLSRYPVVRRDISLAFPREVTVGQVEALFQEAGAPLLCSVELFDTYEQGEEKSLAFHLVFGSEERTLEGAEVDHAFERIVAQAAERLSGRLRS